MDQDLVGYRLAEKENLPNPGYKYQMSTINRKINLVSSDNQDLQEDAIHKRINWENQKIISRQFSFIKSAEVSEIQRKMFQSNIRDEWELNEDLYKLEEAKLNHVKKLILDNKHESAMYFSLQFKSTKFLDAVILLFESFSTKKIKNEFLSLIG